ncbi:MAG: carotenoid biosynthesis protein [Bacteroidales bacterium]
MTPFVLLLNLTLILLYELTITRKRGTGYFITFVVTVFILSYLVEVFGVNTGLIFGRYTYEQGLGLQLFHTPPIIGVCWVILILGSASLSQGISTFVGFSPTRYVDGLFRVLIATFLMISMDLLLEKVSDWLDWWHWESVRVPGRNYLSWILLSLAYHIYYVVGRIQQRTYIAAILFVLQFIFVLFIFMYIRFFH